jgi:hypothetical protein
MRSDADFPKISGNFPDFQRIFVGFSGFFRDDDGAADFAVHGTNSAAGEHVVAGASQLKRMLKRMF